MAELTPRARKILHAIVAEYLQSGTAVGSRTVTRRPEIDLSPATVRNVMSDLEDAGMLGQPHTSAGRVPTELGLRFFLDSLLKVRGLSVREKDAIRGRLADIDGPEDAMVEASKMLSEITHHVGIVRLPSRERSRLKHIEFVPLVGGQLLAVLVTSDDRVENKLIRSEEPIEPRRLERIHNYLTGLLEGLTLSEVRARVARELGAERTRYDQLAEEALRLGEAAVAEKGETPQVIVTGGANVVALERAKDPESLGRMRELLQTLEDRQTLAELLDRTADADGVRVFVGAETAMEAFGDSSIVTHSYGPEDSPLGAIAVVGPMRMNYGKVISIVDFTADVLNKLLSEP